MYCSAEDNVADLGQIEYVFKKPAFLATCMYGILFIIWGNISGNAIAFGIYVSLASDPSKDPNDRKGFVVGLAIMVLTVCASLHVFTRRGGILLNNAVAMTKVTILVTVAILGFVHAGGKYLQARPGGINEEPAWHSSTHENFNITSAIINSAAKNNFDVHKSFHTDGHDVASYVDSLLFALFSCTGFEQPFYALSEFAHPRRVIPRALLSAVAFFVALYALVNVSYFCVVPKETYVDPRGLSPENSANSLFMAATFFHYLFDSSSSSHAGERAMCSLVSFSCFGNIIIMTFTAARVKQEIAKQGVLPYSLFFATGHTTPWAWIRSRFSAPTRRQVADEHGEKTEDHLEKTPMAAFALHWLSSVFLIIVTVGLKPTTQYIFLSATYSYILVNILGFFVSGGLLYLKLDSFFRPNNGRKWSTRARRTGFIPPTKGLHAVIYFAAMSFMLFASFVKPASTSAYSAKNVGYPWYVVPTVGLGCVFFGTIWWLGLKGIERKRLKRLVVTRTPYLVEDNDGSFVQKAELVEHRWVTIVRSDHESGRRRSGDSSEEHEMHNF